MMGGVMQKLKNKLQLKKAYWARIFKIMGMVIASLVIVIPAHSTNSCPVPTHSEASFTVSESISKGTILSGTSLGFSDSDQDILNYYLDVHGDIFTARNKNTMSTDGIQYAEITYGGERSGAGVINYETTPVLREGGRGYRANLYGFDSSNCYISIDIIIYVTDVPELDTMSGSIGLSIVVPFYYVEDTIIANFSNIRDQEGINDTSVAWSREACPAERGLGEWPISRRISSATSESYQLTSRDRGHILSVWGQYETDTDNYKWVCKNVVDGHRILSPGESPNISPQVGYGPVFYYVEENSGSGSLPDMTSMENDESAYMTDQNQDTIRYTISVPTDTPSDIARTIRSAFRVRNTAPNPAADDSEQPISISYNRNFNYETAPEFADDSGRGYEFDVKGCDPHGACDSVGIRVYINDVAEISTVSGSISFTGQYLLSEVLTADFSNITDAEGINTSMNISWRRGPCTSPKGVGDLPTTYGSNNAYVDIGGSNSYTIQAEDVGQIISVWGFYWSDSNLQKWVCRQTSTIRGNSGNPSLPTVSISRTGRSSLPARESTEFTLARTNRNLSSALTLRLHKEEAWEENGEMKTHTENFNKIIPADETQMSFTLTYNREGTVKVKVLPHSDYNVRSFSPLTVTFTVANALPSGQPTITGTVQVGQTLTVDTSSISDGNGISRSFSYTWWKEVSFGPNAGIPQRISGATRSTYTIKQVDARAKIKVKVSYRDDDGFNQLLESDLTDKVTSVADAKPYVVSIALKNDPNGEFISSGSNFEATVGDVISITAYMSKGVSDLSSLNGDVRMNLNIGSRSRTLTLSRSAFNGENTPNRLVFLYTVEEGVSGRVTVPRNGMSVVDSNDNVVPNPSNVNLNYPQTYLANMRVQNTLNVSILDATVYENTDTYIDFNVRLNMDATETITVDYVTSDGTARAGSDYTAQSGTLTFNSGDRIKTIRLDIIDDDIEEGEETFQVKLSNISPSSVRFADDTATGTIVNSDPNNPPQDIEDPPIPPPPSITASFISMPSEHNGTNTFTFELRFSEDLNGLSYKTLKNNGAFQVTNGSITNARRLVSGKSQRWEITVQPNNNNDMTITLPETTDCSVTGAVCNNEGRMLSHSVSAIVQGPEGTTVNPEPPVNPEPLRLSISNATANEETDSSISFSVSLDKNATETTTVNWATSNGTATAGEDYTNNSGIVTFNSGERTKTISVSVINDSLYEDDETFQVTLSSPSPDNVQLSDATATGTIESGDLPPITASFVGVPSEHDGSSTFTFELRFSENVKGLSYKTLKNNSTFQVTNGSITNARRLVSGKNQRWEITVEPSGNDTVSIRLPSTTNCSASRAICHQDGRKLSNSNSATVQGPVGISVSDASANENTDSTINFTVSLSRSSTNTITVNYATQNGTATAGQDYTSKSGTLTFLPSETSQTVSISLLSDSIDEGNETFKLKLSNASSGSYIKDSEGIGTIENSDPMPSAWLSRFGRTVGSQAVDAISKRMGKSSQGNRVMIGGMEMSMAEGESNVAGLQNIHQQFESSRNWDEKSDVSERTVELEELILGTSFNLSGKNEERGQTWSTWGQVSKDGFEGKTGNFNVEGKVTTGFLGADVTSGNWRGGMAVSQSKGEGTFRSSESAQDDGEVESSLTSVFPYLGYEFNDNSIWAIFGRGRGDISVTQFANENRNKDQTIKTDISMRMGAVGAKGPILSQREGDGMNMTVQTDGLYVKTDSEKTRGMKAAETEVTRLRLTLDSAKTFEMENDATFTPSFQMGLRHDGGDAEEGVGLESGVGLSYQAGPLTLEGTVRKLLAHEDEDHEEWGASVALRLEPEKGGRGLSFHVLPTWGDANNVDRLWNVEGVHQLGRDNSSEEENRLEAEIGYGIFKPFASLKGLFTPYFGLSMGDNLDVYRTGTRLSLSPNAKLSLELSRTKGESKEDEDKAIMLQGGFSW